MNYKIIARFISRILAIESVFMLPSLIMALCAAEWRVALAFVAGIGGALLFAGLLILLSRHADPRFFAREGLVCVGLSWIFMSVFGALPFFLSGQIPNYLDALFEIVSGFTTTGASILSEVESLSHAILFWRSFSHWLGGMGVLVFLLAVLPGNDRNAGLSIHLMRAESPGPSVSKLVPKIRDSALILYLIYIALTVLNFIFLLFGGMSVFEAACTAVGTAGTGGFGIRNDSMASYSPYIQNVCTVFMLLFGINFGCYYLLLLRRLRAFFGDEELRLWVGTVIVSAGVIAWNVRGLYATFGETLRHSFFQVATVLTTTGFATTDFDVWPTLSKAIMLCLMVIGGCAGSTGGGFKCSRILLLFKTMRRNLKQILHPQRVEVVRVNGNPVEERILTETSIYLWVYLLLMAVSFLVVSLNGQSVLTSFTAVLSCVNNIGPGLDAVGPTCNFGFFSPLSKVVLILDMLAGRLEIYPVLLLFLPSTWKRK